MKKRNCKARIFLDFDDLTLLSLLREGKAHPITDIKKSLNFSHNALRNHVSRLEEEGFIELKRYERDYKKKYLVLTKLGFKLKNLVVHK